MLRNVNQISWAAKQSHLAQRRAASTNQQGIHIRSYCKVVFILKELEAFQRKKERKKERKSEKERKKERNRRTTTLTGVKNVERTKREKGNAAKTSKLFKNSLLFSAFLLQKSESGRFLHKNIKIYSLSIFLSLSKKRRKRDRFFVVFEASSSSHN